MKDDGKGIMGDRGATGEQIRHAWEQAAIAAMENHRRAGEPVVIWDWAEGRVVTTTADQISAFEEPSLVCKAE